MAKKEGMGGGFDDSKQATPFYKSGSLHPMSA